MSTGELLESAEVKKLLEERGFAAQLSADTTLREQLQLLVPNDKRATIYATLAFAYRGAQVVVNRQPGLKTVFAAAECVALVGEAIARQREAVGRIMQASAPRKQLLAKE
jgi:hypothetical protein